MKKKIRNISNIRHKNIFTITILFFLLTSCGYVSRRNKDFEAGQDGSVKASGQMVPKEEYDALMNKYNQLAANQQTSPGERVSEELINELSSTPKAELAETIDVFDQSQNNEITKSPQPTSPIVIADPNVFVSDNEVEAQFAKLKKAQELIDAKQFDEALSYIKKDTENSSILQVRVKAKFLLGELLLQQSEYDLAMQMFEEIINHYAFSGLVIKTLGRLIHCCEKLKLEDKKTKYFSMLNDIFGTG